MTASDLRELRSEVSRCVKCGTCRSVCPVFKHTGRESMVARGRLALLEASIHDSSLLADSLASILSSCLFCGKCQEHCAAGVPYLTILRRARSVCPDPSVLKDLVVKHLLMGGRFHPMMRVGGRVFQALEEGFMAWPGSARRFPAPASPFFLDRHGGLFPAPGRRKGRVALFVGCTINCFSPGTALSAVALLNAAGMDVVVPAAQVCCGAPASASGYEELAARLDGQNREAFRSGAFDLVCTACPSCGVFLKENGRFVDGRGTAAPVRDLCEVLAGNRLPVEPADGPPVTYHDPCHLKDLQGIARAPRELIALRAPSAFVELADPGRCCGFGGSFSLSHPSLSTALGAERAQSIVSSGAHLAVTACPGCAIQLSGALAGLGSACRAVHLADFLAAGLVCPKEEP